jgi:type II secretory ATPase GspE/PulE/Tfp pilus assembly ATPase PilB-like protein
MVNFIRSLIGKKSNNNDNHLAETEQPSSHFKRRTVADTKAIKDENHKPLASNAEEIKSKANPSHDGKAVITNMSAIPFYEGLVDSKDSGVELNQYQKENYAILLIDKKLKIVTILCSIESQKESTLDNNYLAIQHMCKKSGFKIQNKIITNSQIVQLIHEENKSKSIEKQLEQAEGLRKDFGALITSAMEQGVSDIHIEVTRDEARVRFRKNGFLRNHTPWTTTYARSMATVIYQVIAAEQDVTFNENTPQAAIIDEVINNQRVRVRLNTLPTYPAGFDMILRVLKMGASVKPLPLIDLGYEEEQVELIEECIGDPVGGTLASGTTGSGKTTSMASIISLKAQQFTYDGDCHIKIITVEDPPEIELINVSQVPVQRSKSSDGEKDENPFAKYMNATLRSDPDAILVGEVRDEITAHLLQHAIQSGHQVFSTLHTSSAIAQVDRLRYMGIKSKVLGAKDFISGLIYQALVPVICTNCSIKFDQFVEENKHLRHRARLIDRIYRTFHDHEIEGIRFKNIGGCSHCSNGIAGRTVVAEVIRPSKEMKEFFAIDEDSKALDWYLENGGDLIIDHGIIKILSGRCDPVDIEYKLGNIDAGITKKSLRRIKEVKAARETIVESGPDLDITGIDFTSECFNDKEPANVKNIGNKK